MAGKLPVREATAHDLRESAKKALARLDPAPSFVMDNRLGPGGVRMERSIRLLCTIVWPVLYQVLTLQDRGVDPIMLWCLPKEQATERLPQDTALHGAIQRFHRAIWEYYPAENSLDQALSVIESTIVFLEAAALWWKGESGEP